MKLTGKAKEDFDKWYISKNYILDLTTDLSPHTPVIGFDEIDDSMKYGVFVDWFDSVGIEVNIKKVNVLNSWIYLLKDMKRQGYYLNDYINHKRCETRPEARAAAIEEVNEIYNKKT